MKRPLLTFSFWLRIHGRGFSIHNEIMRFTAADKRTRLTRWLGIAAHWVK